MKKLLVLSIMTGLLIVTQILSGQVPEINISTTTYSDENILQKIEKLNNEDYLIQVQETGKHLIPLSEAVTHEDSINLVFEEIPYTFNKIRFDPLVLKTVLPTVVTIDENKQLQIEQLSLIPILFEAVQRQQLLINSLNSRISELEKE